MATQKHWHGCPECGVAFPCEDKSCPVKGQARICHLCKFRDGDRSQT